MEIETIGCGVFPELVDADGLERLRTEAARLLDGVVLAGAPRRGGERRVMEACPQLADLAWTGALAELARRILGPSARPVRGLLFDKTPDANWRVPWHQDLTIAVRERHDIPGYGPWSVKDGLPHVQPPVAVLEAMVALRLHLDDCPAANGALRVLAGSHRVGRLSAEQISSARRNGSELVCEARAGDVVAMRPLALHASSPSARPGHRRVFHIEYAAATLPPPLAWAEQLPASAAV